jgi:hypothetical protein
MLFAGFLASCGRRNKRRAMGKQPPDDEPKDKSSRTEQARQVVEECANDQREIIKKLRNLPNHS